MKNLFCALSICICFASQASAQFTFGLRVTTSPSVDPGTSSLVANRGTATESLVNISNVNYSEQIGLLGRYDMDHFYFMAEMLYGQTKSDVTMAFVSEAVEGQAPHVYQDKTNYLEMPVTAGVKLGMFEVFSGFDVAHDFRTKGETLSIAGYDNSLSRLRFGWHSGVGVNLGPVLVDVRYQQQFSNYGKGRFLNGEELILKNAPGRLVFALGYRM